MSKVIAKQKVASGVVEQVRLALQPKYRLATCLGFLLGGFVPIVTYAVAHGEIDRGRSLFLQLATYLVVGGLIYSAKTVYDWGNLAFHLKIKSFGFVLLLEGAMIVASNIYISVGALLYLVFINGIATGCNLTQKVKPLTNG